MPNVAFNDDDLKTGTEEHHLEVARERVAQYAAATNHPIAVYHRACPMDSSGLSPGHRIY
jgi:hypothetical protein